MKITPAGGRKEKAKGWLMPRERASEAGSQMDRGGAGEKRERPRTGIPKARKKSCGYAPGTVIPLVSPAAILLRQ